VQGFPGGATPTLLPPVTLITQPLQFTTTAFKNLAVPSGTSVPQPSGPTVSAQEEGMRQVTYSGGYLYSCTSLSPSFLELLTLQVLLGGALRLRRSTSQQCSNFSLACHYTDQELPLLSSPPPPPPQDFLQIRAGVASS